MVAVKVLHRFIGSIIGIIFIVGMILVINMVSQVPSQSDQMSYRSLLKYLYQQSPSTVSTNLSDIYRIPELCTQQIVFVKTHKTAGSTVASIIQRFGMARNLTFATPKRRNYNTFTGFEQFNRNYVFRYTEVRNLFGGFNILATHAIYNLMEMKAVVPNPVFITIIRHPVQQFLSAFRYYNFTYQMKIDGANPVMEFFSCPECYINLVEYGKHQIRNGQLYDLGISKSILDCDLDSQIKGLEKEFHMIMITEYIDESLILLKRLLCWTFEDILYIPLRVNTERDLNNDRETDLNPKFINIVDLETSLNIEHFNERDIRLYRYFNRTFWKKVKEYGDDFGKDLAYFRSKLSQLQNRCQHLSRPIEKVNAFLQERSCSDYFRLDDDNTRLVREKLQKRLDSRCRYNCQQ